MNTIRKFFAHIRQRLLAARIKRETYNKIIPHLRGTTDHGYGFHSAEELAASNAKESFLTVSTLHLLERAASKMGEAEGHALQHIMHRELRERMWEYIGIAEGRILPARSQNPVPAVQAAT